MTLPTFDPALEDQTRQAIGLKRLRLWWAKAEILLGLTGVAVGLHLIGDRESMAIAGGALIVLGGYLALAGHRSHLYLSQNRHVAYLLQVLAAQARPPGP